MPASRILLYRQAQLCALVPGLHVLLSKPGAKKDVDGRDKPGHDESVWYVIPIITHQSSQ